MTECSDIPWSDKPFSGVTQHVCVTGQESFHDGLPADCGFTMQISINLKTEWAHQSSSACEMVYDGAPATGDDEGINILARTAEMALLNAIIVFALRRVLNSKYSRSWKDVIFKELIWQVQSIITQNDYEK